MVLLVLVGLVAAAPCMRHPELRDRQIPRVTASYEYVLRTIALLGDLQVFLRCLEFDETLSSSSS